MRWTLSHRYLSLGSGWTRVGDDEEKTTSGTVERNSDMADEGYHGAANATWKSGAIVLHSSCNRMAGQLQKEIYVLADVALRTGRPLLLPSGCSNAQLAYQCPNSTRTEQFWSFNYPFDYIGYYEDAPPVPLYCISGQPCDVPGARLIRNVPALVDLLIQFPLETFWVRIPCQKSLPYPQPLVSRKYFLNHVVMQESGLMPFDLTKNLPRVALHMRIGRIFWKGNPDGQADKDVEILENTVKGILAKKFDYLYLATDLLDYLGPLKLNRNDVRALLACGLTSGEKDNMRASSVKFLPRVRELVLQLLDGKTPILSWCDFCKRGMERECQLRAFLFDLYALSQEAATVHFPVYTNWRIITSSVKTR